VDFTPQTLDDVEYDFKGIANELCPESEKTIITK
jgi:hypothetical protein